MDPIVIFFGFGVGMLVGLTGMGGGSLMTPLLILVLAVKPVVAIGTDIAYSAVTKSVGGWRHLRLGTVDLGMTLWLALGSVPGAVAGVKLISYFQDRYGGQVNNIVMACLAVALLLVGSMFLIRTLFIADHRKGETDKVPFGSARKKLLTICLGAVLGFLVGLTSIGSGLFIALAMLVVYKLMPRNVVGTDIFHAAILLWAAGIAQGFAGNIDYGLAGSILIGSIPGVWLGSHLSVKLHEDVLRLFLGSVMIASGLSLLDKVGVAIPTTVLAGAPIAILALTGAKLRADRRRHHTIHDAPAGRVAPESAA